MGLRRCTSFGTKAFVVTFCLCLAHVNASPVALFAFGDSYADTGNREQSADSWKEPYGKSWPGTPAGRWSNGHLQTDKIGKLANLSLLGNLQEVKDRMGDEFKWFLAAAALGLPTPTPYASIDQDPEVGKSGINFAVGGSGVTTAYGLTTFSQQIDNFNTTIAMGFYPSNTLAGSVALVSVSGNDYGAWNGQDLHSFVETVVNLTIEGILRLNDLGVRNVIVGNLPPFDCSPTATWAENYTKCTNTSQQLVESHNSLLDNTIQELNRNRETRVVLLDQFASFTDAINEFIEPLRPCCQGIDSITSCASVDSHGEIAYTLCADPSIHFFWDGVHPTEEAWNVVVNLYLQEPGYLVHHRNLTLEGYWSKLRTMQPRPTNAPIGNRVAQHSVEVPLSLTSQLRAVWGPGVSSKSG